MELPEDHAVQEMWVDGTQLAVLLAAAFMLEHWPFERTAARVIATTQARTAAEGVEELLFLQSKAILESGGVFDSAEGAWTKEFIRRRASVEGNLRLTQAQLRSLVLALHACHAEFRNSWEEFCTASPGAMDWYCAGPGDLLMLASRLESLLQQPRE